MAGNPQSDIANLIKLKDAVLSRARPAGVDTALQKKHQSRAVSLRQDAALRWDHVYTVVDDLQHLYNREQKKLALTIKLQKLFPKSWLPIYRIRFVPKRGSARVELALQMRQDTVVTYAIALLDAEQNPIRTVKNGTTSASEEALSLMFREIVRCYFIVEA